jgi:hypothetical protein
MSYVVKGIFVLFPLSCASVVVADVWIHGMQSLPLQFALGIAALFFAVKFSVLAVAALDACIEASRPIMASVRAFLNDCRAYVSSVPARLSALGELTRARPVAISR